MQEQIARAAHSIEIHLLYASIVWLAAWVLTSMRRGTPTTKYWIWVATSLNFVLPLSIVLDGFRPPVMTTLTRLTVIAGMGSSIARNAPAAAMLWAVWSLGTLVMLMRLCIRIQADRRHAQVTADERVHEATPGFLADGVPVRFDGSRHAPAVNGVLRPRISLPAGIDRLLSEHELNAVLIHEVTHAKRGDNLIRLIHEVALCALWFHPLVWITGSRLALYRELSCDESVIRSKHGGHLVSGLAKLAGADEAHLLQATASSFISDRLARLTAAPPQRTRLEANALLTVSFAAILLTAVFVTAAQTTGSSRIAALAYAPCPVNNRVVAPSGLSRTRPSANEAGASTKHP